MMVVKIKMCPTVEFFIDYTDFYISSDFPEKHTELISQRLLHIFPRFRNWGSKKLYAGRANILVF